MAELDKNNHQNDKCSRTQPSQLYVECIALTNRWLRKSDPVACQA
jgi:hypothetical protein